MLASLARRSAIATLAVAIVAAVLPARAQQAPPAAAPGAPPPDSQRFDDWRRQCEPPQPGKPETCFVFQKVVVKETGRELLAIAIGYLGEKRIPAAILTVPLGIYLPHGLVFTVPGVQPIRVVVETCTPQGCRGGTALSDDILAAMRKGERGEVTLQDARQHTVNLPISLKGFTRSFASLNK